MNKITKHKVATYFSGREIYSHLYDSKEKALSKVKVGSIHKYEGEVEIYLLEEPEITDPTISKKETVEIPRFVADWIEFCKKNEASLGECLTAMNINHQRAFNWLNSNRLDTEEIVARAWLHGYTITPENKMQVIVKNYDSTVFTTEIPEDEATKLIEGWKGNE